MDGRPPRPTSDEYENLVEGLVIRFAPSPGVSTTWIKQNVSLAGASGPSQIDVVWDFTDDSGVDRRIIFEARSYARRLDRKALHAFRSVVDDLQTAARPVVGVMVTTEGYQKGAKAVADTYGVVVLELRTPTAKDWKGRVQSIVMNVTAQGPVMQNVHVALVNAETEGQRRVTNAATITDARGLTRSLVEVLLNGELGALGTPREVHPVRRVFQPPAELRDGDELLGHVAEITAEVGDSVTPPMVTTTNFENRVTWLLKNGLTDARVWLAKDGKVWTTDAPSP